jgi:hypothetical protein
MLRNEPPFGALRLEHLVVVRDDHFAFDDAILALAADLTASSFVRELTLCFARLDTPAASDALVDAAIVRRLHTLRLIGCKLHAASAPALARLLGGGALATLEITGRRDPSLDASFAAGLATALHACSTLTALTLSNSNLWRDPGAAAVLLSALTGHASLQTLLIADNPIQKEDRAAAGAVLGALVAVNAPALTELDVSWCFLGDAGLGLLFNALPANTHLRTLRCRYNTPMYAFVRDVLLPAVRANGSLRQLRCTRELHNSSDAAEHALAEAVALVAQRAAGR